MQLTKGPAGHSVQCSISLLSFCAVVNFFFELFLEEFFHLISLATFGPKQPLGGIMKRFAVFTVLLSLLFSAPVFAEQSRTFGQMTSEQATESSNSKNHLKNLGFGRRWGPCFTTTVGGLLWIWFDRDRGQRRVHCPWKLCWK